MTRKVLTPGPHWLLANVFGPEGGVTLNKLPHELDAALVLDDLDLNAAAREPLLLAHEGLVLADDDPWDAVEQDGAAAHGTG